MAIPTSEFRLITPALAEHWLTHHNQHNRPCRDNVVERYARDMLSGNWHLTHQGIAFSSDGTKCEKCGERFTLIDGQHRLWAIFMSKVAGIKMNVATGMAIESQEVVDGGVLRNAHDVVALRDGVVLPPLSMAVARFLAKQCGIPSPTRQEQVRAYDHYRPYIDAAMSLFPPSRVKGVQVREVMVVLTRALHTYDKEALRPFVQVLITGMPGHDHAKDEVIIQLRNILIADNPSKEDIYGKTARALRAWLDGDKVKKLIASAGEQFPIPEDSPNRKRARLATVKGNRDKRHRGAEVPYPAATRRKSIATSEVVQ